MDKKPIIKADLESIEFWAEHVKKYDEYWKAEMNSILDLVKEIRKELKHD